MLMLDCIANHNQSNLNSATLESPAVTSIVAFALRYNNACFRQLLSKAVNLKDNL